MSRSKAEIAFENAWALLGLRGSDIESEYRFHPARKWLFDFAFPSQRLAIEIDGRGRHQTIAGVRGDCEKLNAATVLGWRVLRFPATDKARVTEWVRTVIEALALPPEGG